MKKETITTGTLARLLVLLLALGNQVLLMSGHVPIELEENQIYELCSTLATVLSALVAAWKNNSITEAAIQGDAVMRRRKAAKKGKSL